MDRLFAARVARLAEGGLESVLFRDPEQLVAVLDADGAVLEVHLPDDAPYALRRNQFVGRSWWEVPMVRSASGWEDLWRARLLRVRESGRPLTFDGELSAAGEATFGVHGQLLVVREHGEAVGYVVEMRTVPEGGPQILGNEAGFRRIVEVLPHLTWMSGPDGAFEYLAPGWEAFTGRPEASLLGFGLDDYVHPDDRFEGAERADAERDGQLRSVRMRRSDGAWRQLESVARVVLGEDGATLFTVGGVLDVTDLRQAEIEARHGERQLQDALTIAGYGRFVWDRRTDRFTADSEVERVLGLEPGALQGVAVSLALRPGIHPADRDRVREHILAASEPGGPELKIRFRYLAPGKNGSEGRYISLVAHCEPEEDGRPRLVGVIADVTNAFHEEQALVRQQRIQALGTLAGGVAHDFNNVISAILSYASFAEQQIRDGASPMESVAEISRGALRARDIVRRLLAFSRDEKPRSERFSLGEVGDEAVALLRPTLPPAVRLRVEVAPGLPDVLGDESQLHQVVVNLLTNAAQAIADAGGSIRLLVDRAPDQGRRAGIVGPAVRLRVIDDGPGIPPHLAARIFDPFYTTKPADQGTGLGLAAAQSIIDEHKGSLTVESRPSPTTTFTISLPAAPVQASQPPVPTAPGGADTAEELPGRAPHAVFVDDEPALVRLADVTLPRAGYRVTSFSDSGRALEFLRTAGDEVDALITDLSMPTIDGLELARRARELLPGLPIVMTSGYLDLSTRQAIRDVGIDEVVVKPYAVGDLAGIIERLTARVAGGA